LKGAKEGFFWNGVVAKETRMGKRKKKVGGDVPHILSADMALLLLRRLGG
jgi:hypothetical protein